MPSKTKQSGTNSRKKPPTRAVVIRIKKLRLRKHIEKTVWQTGCTPEAAVYDMFRDLEISRTGIKLHREFEERRLLHWESLLREAEAKLEEVVAQLKAARGAVKVKAPPIGGSEGRS
jgi:hypothetical protein